MKLIDFKNNHVYIGSEDRTSEWAGLKDGDAPVDGNQIKLITQVREKIKNYLQLDNVSFLFGTGSSIHLGAAGIQNIPEQVEKDIAGSDDADVKDNFANKGEEMEISTKKYVSSPRSTMIFIEK